VQGVITPKMIVYTIIKNRRKLLISVVR